MKRRSITLGVEQVAELMQRLSKKAGLLESIGIDVDAIPSREDVFSTKNDNRFQKQQGKMASHGKKRKRVQELEEELANTHLPARKRLRTEHDLYKAREKVQASMEKLEKALSVKPQARPPKPREPGVVSKAVTIWHSGIMVLDPSS